MKNFIADALLRKFAKAMMPRVKKQPEGRMLWPAYRGTYNKAKHGPLKDENGNPLYA